MVCFLPGVKNTDAPLPQPAGRRRIPLADLLRGDTEVVILHDGAEYVLRLTRNGKLLLTK